MALEAKSPQTALVSAIRILEFGLMGYWGVGSWRRVRIASFG